MSRTKEVFFKIQISTLYSSGENNNKMIPVLSGVNHQRPFPKSLYTKQQVNILTIL
uniref:Uncharacterized protein n=1 Tax=Anguilla anguilla TaxID=7936 RepID=A0A0E9WL40_ANGAN